MFAILFVVYNATKFVSEPVMFSSVTTILRILFVDFQFLPTAFKQSREVLHRSVDIMYDSFFSGFWVSVILYQRRDKTISIGRFYKAGGRPRTSKRTRWQADTGRLRRHSHCFEGGMKQSLQVS